MSFFLFFSSSRDSNLLLTFSAKFILRLKMLFSKTLAVAALFLGLAGAIPIDDLALFSDEDSEDPEKTNVLAARDNCVTFNEVVNKLSDHLDILAYVSTGYYSTLYVCRRMNQPHCDEIAKAIASGIASIAFIAGRATGSIPKSQAGEHQDQDQTLAGFLRNALSEDGEVFEGVHEMTHSRARAGDAGDKNAPLEIASVRNWNYDDTLVNFDVHDFGGGDGHILVPLSFNNGTSDAGTTAEAEERYGVQGSKAPGFKISYSTKEKTKLSKSQSAQMANAVAADWASHAKSENKMSNYIGLWKTGHRANFYYRIIPEVSNFGSNYESVDFCGSMTRFL